MTQINLLDPPVKRRIGNYREMAYDATLELDGLVWCRAEGGFGDDPTQREDWVCDVDECSVHVVRYLKPRPESWGTRPNEYTTDDGRDTAMRAVISEGIRYLFQSIRVEAEKLARMRSSHARLLLAELRVGETDGHDE